jgi:hypothetical protein
VRPGIYYILIVLMARIAFADELVFNNGDKLTGTVVQLAGGKVTFKSAVAGEVTIEAGHARIGERDFVLGDIRGINPPQARWGGKASLGLSVISTTNHNDRIDFLLSLARTGAKDRIAIDSAYFFARTDGDTTTNNWFINGDYNFARRGRIYVFANGRLEQDRIQDLDLRSILGSGLGYIASERPDFSFRGEGGLAVAPSPAASSERVTDVREYRFPTVVEAEPGSSRRRRATVPSGSRYRATGGRSRGRGR